MDFFRNLTRLGRRRRQRGTPEAGPEASRAPSEESPVRVRYPLYDPRQVVPQGEEPPDFSAHEAKARPSRGRGVAFRVQATGLSSIPDEVPRGEAIFLPHSGLTFEEESDASLEDRLYLMEFVGDCSPVSSPSPSECSVAAAPPPLAAQMLRRAERPAPHPQREVQPLRSPRQQEVASAKEEMLLKRAEDSAPAKTAPSPRESKVSEAAKPTPSIQLREAEKTPREEVVERDSAFSPQPQEPAAAVVPVQEPRAASSSESEGERAVSATSSSPSNRSRDSEASAVEDLPTAPHTPRDLPLVQPRAKRVSPSKERDAAAGPPRILLIQPHVSPHPATIRMQREGRRTKVRWSQLQRAIELYAAQDCLRIQKGFRIQPHDTDACDMCQFGDFTDSPLLW